MRKLFDLTVNPAPIPPPSIVTDSPLPDGEVGAVYFEEIKAVDGDGSYTFSLVSGALPDGLTLSPMGFITGVPTTAGTTSFEVEVTEDTEMIIDITNPSSISGSDRDISLPPDPPGPFNEPPGFTFFNAREFNSFAQNIDDVDGAEGWRPNEWDGKSNATIIQDANAPLSPLNVLRIRYPAGMVGGTSTVEMETPPIPSGQRKLYHRFAVKLSENFQAHSTSANKIYYAWVNRELGNKIFYNLYGTGDGPLRLTMHLQSTAETEWYRRNLFPNLGRSGEIVRGRWYVIEVLIELDDGANGVMRMWIDEVMTHEYTDLSFLKPEAAGAAFRQIQLSPVWGGGGDQIVETFYMFMDHSYVSVAP